MSEFNDNNWKWISPHLNDDYTIVVETGTFIGDTAEYFSRHFKEVHTIELDRGLFTVVSNKFINYPNVFCYLGDSASILSSGGLIDDLNNKKDANVFFFLDAHWSGDDTVDWANSKWTGVSSWARGKNTAHRGNAATPTAVEQQPLEEEIIHIYNKFKNECVICVDDWNNIGEDGLGVKNNEFMGEDWSNIDFNKIKENIKDRLLEEPIVIIDENKLIIKLKKM
jgi:hypothetical protein